MNISGIDDDDVVSMDPSWSIVGTQIFKFSQLIKTLSDRLEAASLGSKFRKRWIDEGMECEVLPASTGGWRKGKLRIRVQIEFIPDDPVPDGDQTTGTKEQ